MIYGAGASGQKGRVIQSAARLVNQCPLDDAENKKDQYRKDDQKFRGRLTALMAWLAVPPATALSCKQGRE
jgi:hypothetical protein